MKMTNGGTNSIVMQLCDVYFSSLLVNDFVIFSEVIYLTSIYWDESLELKEHHHIIPPISKMWKI